MKRVTQSSFFVTLQKQNNDEWLAQAWLTDPMRDPSQISTLAALDSPASEALHGLATKLRDFEAEAKVDRAN